MPIRFNLSLGNRNYPSSPRYRFPLTNQDDYKGRISFTALETDYQSLGQIGSTVVNDLANTQFGEEQGPSLEGFYGQVNRSNSVRKENPRPVGTVQLYLPTSLAFQDTIDYSATDLGAVGAAAAAGLQSGGGIGAAAKRGIQRVQEDFGSFVDAFKTGVMNETGTIAVLRTIGKVSDTVRGAVEVTTGLTLNPNRRSLLKGVALRTFNFSFNLIPENRKEAEMIKDMIYFFRTQMYPEDYIEAGVAVGYRFPNKFRIDMSYDGKPVATKILPCFLEGFNTNYNPNSMSFHEDGNFPEINITLTFREERTLRQQDIEIGY